MTHDLRPGTRLAVNASSSNDSGPIDLLAHRQAAQTGPAPSIASVEEEYAAYVRKHVSKLLGAVKADVLYHRAQGDHLYYRNTQGEEVEVLDLLGGFGANLFGHNHPRLVAALNQALQQQRPFNAQASIRGPAAHLARRLSELVGRRTQRDYVVTFGNSGAECVEAALKHAELEAAGKLERLRAAHRNDIVQLTEAFRNGQLRAIDIGGEQRAIASEDDFALVLRGHELAFELALGNNTPVIWAIKRGFHGKTTGALKLTYNASYRAPWSRFGSAVFLEANSREALEREARRSLVLVPKLVLTDGVLSEESSMLSNVIACFVEPIQGEGGIHVIDPQYASLLRLTADQLDIPLVIDEIQSGLGRTGEFLASEQLGVHGDYYLFAKALGGGLTKLSALLVDRQRYCERFDYQHTSTFAEDDLSSSVALEALDLIEADGEQLIADCRAKGAYFKQRLEQLAQDYPQQIAEVRGRGLMLGLDIRSQRESGSSLIRVLSEQNLLVAFIAGHLLRQHRVRVAPALSSENTLRLEPSSAIEIKEIDRFCDAMTEIARMLRDGDSAGLTRFLGDDSRHAAEPIQAAEQQERKSVTTSPRRARQRAAFLLHYLEPGDLRSFDAGLRGLSDEACRQFLERTSGVIEPFVGASAVVDSPAGDGVELSVVAVPFTSEQVMAAMRSGEARWAVDMVRRGVQAAVQAGCSVVGLGGYTSIVTDNCRLVEAYAPCVTSGNSLTVVAAVDATIARAKELGIAQPVLGVVGATGNIGMMMAEEFARQYACKRAVLVGRQGAARRLQRVAQRLHVPVTVDTQLSALRECNVILAASNAPFPIIQPEHLGQGPIVLCDVAAPRDVSPLVSQARKDVHVLRGGLIRLPNEQSLDIDGMPLEPGLIYACMAETLLLGLSGRQRHFSLGNLERTKIEYVRSLAHRHSFMVEAKQDT